MVQNQVREVGSDVSLVLVGSRSDKQNKDEVLLVGECAQVYESIPSLLLASQIFL